MTMIDGNTAALRVYEDEQDKASHYEARIDHVAADIEADLRDGLTVFCQKGNAILEFEWLDVETAIYERDDFGQKTYALVTGNMSPDEFKKWAENALTDYCRELAPLRIKFMEG